MQPLHLRHRPQTFADLVGQDFVASTLARTLDRGNIAPAYLFVGSRGTGKTSTARIFARGLNCETSDTPTSTPCGECRTCCAIDSSNAIDVTEIDAASNNGVDFARELRSSCQFSAVGGKYKIFVIDEAHMLTQQAQNALLKTIEEPPKNVVFILATTDPHKLLDTIRSRCHEFKFRPAPVADVCGLLRRTADDEAIAIDNDAIKAIAQASRGGLRNAQTLLGLLASTGDPITPDDVFAAVGAVSVRSVLPLVKAIETNDATATINHARDLLSSGAEPAEAIDTVLNVYRDVLTLTTTGDRTLLLASADAIEAIATLASRADVTTTIAKLERLRRATGDLKSVSEKQLNVWFELAAIELATMQPTKPEAEPKAPEPKRRETVRPVVAADLTPPPAPWSDEPEAATPNDEAFDFGAILASLPPTARRCFAGGTGSASGVITLSSALDVKRAKRHADKLAAAYSAAGFAVSQLSFEVA